MLFQWLGSGSLLGLAVVCLLQSQPKDTWFIPKTLGAITLAGFAYPIWRDLQKHYEDAERTEDMLNVLQDTQGEEQLEYLETAAERRKANEQADLDIERQLRILERTAPLFSQILQVTGQQGPVVRMALGMIQNGTPIGEALIAAADAEMKLEQAKLATQIQQRQIELQAIQAQIAPTQTQTVTTTATAVSQSDEIIQLSKAAAVAGIQTECLRVDKAPSHQRLIFSLRTVDYAALPKWRKAAKVALGKEEDLPMYVYGPEQIAVEVGLKPEERTFYDFPTCQWNRGSRIVVVGQSLDGEVSIDLADEDTPQILVAGTTGSGKSNFLRMAAYCLLMQGARVDICGGKVSDYEDFAPRFASINMSDMGQTAKLVREYYEECDRRNSMTKDQLAVQPAWILLIDEYKGTVPIDEKAKKLYDDQLSEVIRRGRGLKIHVVVGLQRGSKRANNDPQGLPPDIRDNLPCRIAFKMVDAGGGRMVLHHNGECVTSLQGKGDGIIQAGVLNTRLQAYRFEKIPG